MTSHRKFALCLLLFALSTCSWLYFGHKMSAERDAESELIKPRMLELAQQGKPAAVRWVYEHGLSEYKNWSELDEKLAGLLDPEAMYMHAYRLEGKGDKDLAMQWYEKSAVEGYPRAVLKLLKPDSGLL